MMKLKGKTAVVIGASGGIGREISMALAEKGVNLILVARRKVVISFLKEEAERLGVEANGFSCDVTKPDSIEGLVDKIKKGYKNIDFLFHTAGIGIYKEFEKVTLDEWNTSMAVNVDSVFYMTQKLLPLLKKSKKPFVVVMGSGMGKIALSERSAYCASKFALRGLVLSLSKEYKKKKVNFIHLTLGSVLTSFGPLSKQEKEEKRKKGKKYLDPEWLAHHVVTKLEHETLDPETPVYPQHYYDESRKGKR
jgi:3-oxoacyl-[acyl-carrier protein] reductase